MGNDVSTVAGEGLTEPLGAPWRRLLRRAVLDHALSERRRRYPPLLHVGTPGARETTLRADLPGLDEHGLRVEVLEAMLRRVGALDEERRSWGGAGRRDEILVWLSRRGDLDLQDVDAAWLRATRAAGAELRPTLGRELPMVVLNRHAWRDPRSGVGQRWQRLRAR